MSRAVRFVVLSLVITGLVIVVDPSGRATALRVELFVLAAALAVALVQRSDRRSPAIGPSPFDTAPPAPPPPRLPADLERLAVDVGAMASPAARGRVPGGLRMTARGVAARRLADHHGVDLDDPNDAVRARAVLGADLWAALRNEPTTMTADDLVDALERL